MLQFIIWLQKCRSTGQSHSALLHICAKTHSQGNPTLRFCTSAPKPTLRAFASALLRFCAKNRLCASANASALLHCAALTLLVPLRFCTSTLCFCTHSASASALLHSTLCFCTRDSSALLRCFCASALTLLVLLRFCTHFCASALTLLVLLRFCTHSAPLLHCFYASARPSLGNADSR